MDEHPTRPPGGGQVADAIHSLERTLQQLGLITGPMPLELERALMHHFAEATDRGMSTQAQRLFDVQHELDRRIMQVRHLMIENRDLRLKVAHFESLHRDGQNGSD